MSDHDRLLTLELELKQLRTEVNDLEKKVSYYDRMALKWGGACMGAVALGALISGHFDKVKDKIWAFFQ